MIPASFDYHAPASLPEALALLTRYGEEAKVLSGGQSLLPLLKLRLGQAAHLVDIGRIPGLEYVREEGGMLRLGGRTRESALEHSEVVKARYPILVDTTKVIADQWCGTCQVGGAPRPWATGQRSPGDDDRPPRRWWPPVQG
jgi:carbon-monoxide dehydrogenase medium subunit